jgi:hypothetical protein
MSTTRARFTLTARERERVRRFAAATGNSESGLMRQWLETFVGDTTLDSLPEQQPADTEVQIVLPAELREIATRKAALIGLDIRSIIRQEIAALDDL